MKMITFNELHTYIYSGNDRFGRIQTPSAAAKYKKNKWRTKEAIKIEIAFFSFLPSLNVSCYNMELFCIHRRQLDGYCMFKKIRNMFFSFDRKIEKHYRLTTISFKENLFEISFLSLLIWIIIC